jgi:hypothetical protein
MALSIFKTNFGQKLAKGDNFQNIRFKSYRSVGKIGDKSTTFATWT